MSKDDSNLDWTVAAWWSPLHLGQVPDRLEDLAFGGEGDDGLAFPICWEMWCIRRTGTTTDMRAAINLRLG